MMKFFRKTKSISGILCTFALIFLLVAFSSINSYADFAGCAIDWSSFSNNPGFITDYTYQGQIISDYEAVGSGDPTRGQANVTPAATDLASYADAVTNPGSESTPSFGYYNGGTPYDPADPSTMEDDVIFFRMRVTGDPNDGGNPGTAFKSYHWNILIDVDGDGYKEYWVDLEGSCSNTDCDNTYDRLNVLYDNSNQQDISDPDAAGVRVDHFQAQNDVDNIGLCTSTLSDPDPEGCRVDSDCPGADTCTIMCDPTGMSHTRIVPTTDGSGDYWIEIQVPMTSFNDSNGNQVLWPDSPVAFVYSTGASNQDPLQKDHMMDLNYISNSDPITFGDIVYPNGKPIIEFTDSSLNFVDFYTVTDNLYTYVKDPAAETGRFCEIDTATSCETDADCPGAGDSCNGGVIDSITVTMTNPTTGDDETVNLVETGPLTGIFTNQNCASDISTCISSSSNPGTDNDQDLEINNGDVIYVSYTNPNSITVTDDADIIDACGATIKFSRANGIDVTSYSITSDPATSDQMYVNVIHAEANTSPASQETITVTLTGTLGFCSTTFTTYCSQDSDCPGVETCNLNVDSETLTLVETGNDTGEFRNTNATLGDDGLQTMITNGIDVSGGELDDDLWEDVDGGVVTVDYIYTSSNPICTGSPYTVSSTASLFSTVGAGRVAFMNGAGTQDISLYAPNEPVFIKVVDNNACSTTETPPGIETVTATVTSPDGDSETITLYETFAGSGEYMNRENDLVTTAGSAVVTSASSTFQADGVSAGDTFVIANGPDEGTYTVATVDSETQITLTTSLSASRTAISFTASPLMTSTYDGASVTNDLVIEVSNGNDIDAAYTDCDDSDSNPGNDIKTDTASYNAPDLVINSILFYPDNSTCQTEYIELYNSSPNPFDATNYVLTDEDSFSYTIPSITLQSGESIILSLYDTASAPTDYYSSGIYYVFDTSSPSFPSDSFGDPGAALDENRADQISLYDPSSAIKDYVSWSATLSPSVDFLGDDSAAVTANIWQDDSFKNVAGMTIGYAIERSPAGNDTNDKADWVLGSISSTVCDSIILTQAVVSSFGANRNGDNISVEWETSSESGTVGFHVLRYDLSSGRYKRVNETLLPGLMTSQQGGKYKIVDPEASTTGSNTYVLVEVEQNGNERMFGPYTIDINGSISIAGSYPDEPNSKQAFNKEIEDEVIHFVDDEGTIIITDKQSALRRVRIKQLVKTFLVDESEPRSIENGPDIQLQDRQPLVTADHRDEQLSPTDVLRPGSEGMSAATLKYVSMPHAITDHKQARIEEARRLRELARLMKRTRRGNSVKVSIRSNGLNFVDAGTLSSLLKIPLSRMKDLISNALISISHKGAPIAYHRAEEGNGIFFYSQAPESIYSNQTVYWIGTGKGKTIRTVSGNDPLSAYGTRSFADEIRYEENNFPATALFDEPSSDYWLWQYVVAGNGETSFNFSTPGLSNVSATASLSIHLMGATDVDSAIDHHAAISINGIPVGETSWDGTRPHSVELYFDSDIFNDGDNMLSINGSLDTGAPYSIFYLDSFAIRYMRNYVAINDVLAFSSNKDKVLTVEGFSSPDIMLMDVTEPPSPLLITGANIAMADNGYSISFSPVSSGRDYIAISRGSVNEPAMWADSASSLRSRHNRADYILIVPSQLKEASSALAEHRKGQGYTPMIIDLEDIMDEFNHGIYDPETIRRFLSYSVKNWALSPKYVVLVGEGTFDYKNYLGTDDNLIPTAMISTPNGLFPSDNYFADLSGDNVPDIAIGRLPVVSDKELGAVINKIISYESLSPVQKKVLFIADDPSDGADFSVDSDSISTLFPHYYKMDKVYLSESSPAVVHNAVMDALNNGIDMVNYIGHGGLDRIADEGLLISGDIETLEENTRLPVFNALTCMVGQFAFPGHDSLGELLSIKPKGGAVAVWSPAGLSINSRAVTLNGEFYKALFDGTSDNSAIGDIIIKAFKGYSDKGMDPFMIYIYNLLGDPALIVH
ncbi:MAG: lamin tail domain-containing protein [Nitrospirota bacterium]|nr:MAG: lamin tail domain-containing protein [Nitrospirota bacterium]